MLLTILDDNNIVELTGNDLIEKLEEFNKNLEDILATIYHHFTSGDTVKRFQYALKELGDYTSHYFYCEEQWMNLTSYDEEDLHKDEHQIFTHHINEILARLAEIDGNSSLNALLDLTKNFTQHILISDKKFRKYIINNPT
jgi:hemerythrin-like metal-binding protein